jgi:Na+/phosphate symporter
MMNINKITYIQNWLLAQIDNIQKRKNSLNEIEVEYYDTFFEVHSDILETLWVKIMEGDKDERSRVGN